MQMIQDQSTSNATSITQKAALAALKGPHGAHRRDGDGVPRAPGSLRHGGLNAIPGVRCRRPEGAFYVFPDVSA